MEKKRMENKMQDSKREELIKALKDKYGQYIRDVRYSIKYYDINLSYPAEPQEVQRNVVEDITVVESMADFIATEISKAKLDILKKSKKIYMDREKMGKFVVSELDKLSNKRE